MLRQSRTLASLDGGLAGIEYLRQWPQESMEHHRNAVEPDLGGSAHSVFPSPHCSRSATFDESGTHLRAARQDTQ